MQWGTASVLWGDKYCGGCSVQWGITSVHVGDNISTVGITSVLWRDTFSTVGNNSSTGGG